MREAGILPGFFVSAKKPTDSSVAGGGFQVVEVIGKNVNITRKCFTNCNKMDCYFSLCNHEHCFDQER
ncbi:hypothetical protein BvCmsKSNP037_00668 [Escherichia coli]|nr:hypothetical protein BvCmsKSNP037_00668 [Escherichia coli]GDO46880.1 hypothetical protein BvCmsNSNP019_01564 [Escherichia coli]